MSTQENMQPIGYPSCSPKYLATTRKRLWRVKVLRTTQAVSRDLDLASVELQWWSVPFLRGIYTNAENAWGASADLGRGFRSVLV